MKLLISAWLPKPTPIASAPPRIVNAVSGTLIVRRAYSGDDRQQQIERERADRGGGVFAEPKAFQKAIGEHGGQDACSIQPPMNTTRHWTILPTVIDAVVDLA